MAAYLLTWNPNAWSWSDLDECVKFVETQGNLEDRWSVGNTQRILPNDRFYLMQLGAPSRGIIGAGYFASRPYPDAHWNGVEGEEAIYCQIEFDQLVHPETKYLVSHDQLKKQFPHFIWTPQKSGNQVPVEIADALDELLGQQNAPDSPVYEEGARHRVISNRTEREPRARAACLAHYGLDCVICGFNFGQFYGDAGEGLIHVHHLEPLAASVGARQTDPIRDLRPVCANCHAVIHRRQQPRGIEEMKALVRRS